MNPAQFLSDYMFECVSLGVNDPDGICKRVKDEIASIDTELSKVDSLRIRKLNLNQILVYFGEKQKRAFVNAQANLTDDPESLALQKRICDVIEESGPVTNRELITAVGKYQEDIKVVLAIKCLGEKQCIERDGSSENRIIKGPNWDSRPNQCEESG